MLSQIPLEFYEIITALLLHSQKMRKANNIFLQDKVCSSARPSTHRGHQVCSNTTSEYYGHLRWY